MEPPRGFWLSLGRFICFLPYFVGLLILGLIKGIIFCPLICLIMTIGNSAIILGLWPVHVVWTNYSILRSIKFRPVLKLLLCFLATILLLLWPVIGIVGSIIGGAAYGLLSPMFATFKAVGEGTTDKFFHCIYDGTWDTVRQSFTFIRDFCDVCYHSYKEVMSDLQHQGPQEGKCHKIRLLHLPGAILAGILGFLVDMPVISLVAICKSPIMLIKGWHRLFHDCIGREGPFLETICVPFAGLAILLWPLAVAGAVLASMVSSIFLGAYAGAVVYQESSMWNGLCYIVASLSIYDEYSNDVLDLQGGSCFSRPRYRRKDAESEPDSRASSFSRPASFRRSVSRTPSMKAPMVDLKPFELLDSLFEECKRHGEIMVFEGLITVEDIVNAKSNKDNGKVISIGLPAYCLLQALLRSIKANSAGILLSNNVTEITSANRPKDVIFDWFFNPLLIIKDQIKAQNLSEAEEDYFCKLVLLSGDPERLKKSNIGSAPESELRQAELHALARRLRGITKSISRYPTFRRRFEDSIKIISEELAKKNEASKSAPERQVFTRSRSAFARIFSQRSFNNRTDRNGPPVVIERELEIA